MKPNYKGAKVKWQAKDISFFTECLFKTKPDL